MPQNQTTTKLYINAIKAFTDNYIWAITNNVSNNLAVVDPGDADVCIQYIEANKLTLTAILITHHHADHIGGIKKLKNYCDEKQWPISIFTPTNEDIPFSTTPLAQDDIIELPELNASFQVIDLPGHTLGHIAYYGNDILFCGDTLFSGGCGRIFEGTPKQMLSSLNKLKALPERTHIYCTHEYTLANLNFALTVEPSNLELIEYYNQVKILREKNKITLPSSVSKEKQINPFLRCLSNEIIESVNEFTNTQLQNEEEVFSSLRKWKDNF